MDEMPARILVTNSRFPRAFFAAASHANNMIISWVRTRRTRSRSGGSASTSSDSDEEEEAAAASPRRPLRKRKPSADADGSTTRQIRSKPRPVSDPPPEAAAAALDDGDDSHSIYGGSSSDDDDGEASSDWDVAEVAVSVRMFPDLPPRSALAIWTRFLDIANACLKRYNAEHQDVHFVVHRRTHALGCGLLFLGEDDSDYYHLNFHAHDKKQKQRHRRHSQSSSQLFFAEIRVDVEPKEEDVTCCCPVSHSDAGGKRVETRADALKYKFPAWGTAGMDRECCYGCPKAIKHPDGASYVAGHVADPRYYFVP